VQPWQVIFEYYSLLLCRILQVNFAEFHFHALQ